MATTVNKGRIEQVELPTEDSAAADVADSQTGSVVLAGVAGKRVQVTFVNITTASTSTGASVHWTGTLSTTNRIALAGTGTGHSFVINHLGPVGLGVQVDTGTGGTTTKVLIHYRLVQ